MPGGVFLQPFQREKLYDAGFIVKAVTAWLAAVPALLFLSAAVIAKAELGNAFVGYASSFISFFAAVAAGAAAGRVCQAGILYSSLVSAAVIVTVLLTTGFLINGAELESAGIISVASFTFSGCLAGGIVFSGNKQKKQKRQHKKLT